MISPLQLLIEELSELGELDAFVAGLTSIERAAAATTFQGAWARPEQLQPAGAWRSFGILAGRGYGKDFSISHVILDEVRAGRARRIGCVMQTLDDCVAVIGNGESGLVAQSPPWDRPQWNCGRLHFINGASVEFFSAESPSSMRGHQFDTLYLGEICAWPTSRREETYATAMLTLRLGLARLLWSTTPRRGVAVLRDLLQRAALYPTEHYVSIGSSWDNAPNLARGTVQEWQRQFTGQRALEEIEGIFTEGDMGALFNVDDIEAARRDAPTRFDRCVIGIDPAISADRGSDLTGIVEAGYAQGQVFVSWDGSGRHVPTTWSALAVERYVSSRCDCIVAERNAGGDLVSAMLRTAAMQRGLQVAEVDLAAQTRHVSGVVNLKQITSRRSKESRAEPVAALYSQHRVSHVRDAALDELEEELITWCPDSGMRSPNRIDALTFAVSEVANLVGPMQTNADTFRKQLACCAAINERAAHPRQGIPQTALERLFAGYRHGQGRRI